MAVFTREKFESDCDELLAEIYSQQPPKNQGRMSRFHRAIQIVLYSQQPESNDIANQVLSDGSDQGIDYFYVSEDDIPVVSVIQVKDNEVFDKQSQKDAVTKMVDEIRLLLSRQKADASWDERRQDRFDALRGVKAKTETEYLVNYVLILTGGPQPKVTVNDFASDRFDATTDSLEVLGLDQLIQREVENLEPPRPDIEFQLDTEQSFSLNVEGQVSAIVTYMAASKYVSATKPHGSHIFRLNPRLFLGKGSKTNKKILETLGSADGRKSFHFYNNGITAVCEDLEVSDQGHVVATDFQVVNGCQSTETLWEYAKGNATLLDEILVPLRVINTGKNVALAEKISEYTNSQTAIASADLIARTPLQERLRNELGALAKPIFYETRRGAWNAVTPVERERFRVSPGEWTSKTVKNIRHLKLKELAQAMLAVTRSPNAAKEQISSLLSSTGDDSIYKKVLEFSWSDISQVQLVVELFKFCSNKDNWMPDFDNEKEAKEFSAMAGLGRFYVMNLVYAHWAKKANHAIDPDNPSLISAEKSRDLLLNFKASIGKLAEYAVTALLLVKEDEKIDTRLLLRNSKYRAAIESKFAIVVMVAKSS